jgi:hypothetical protein
MKVEGIRGIPWLIFDQGFPSLGPASQLDDTATFSLEAAAAELTTARDRVVTDLLRYLFYATDFNVATAESHLESFVKCGYRYNMWPIP